MLSIMGIRISQPVMHAKEQTAKSQLQTECRESPTVMLKTNEPQRNDNATKLISIDRQVLLNSDYLSSSSVSTVSSKPKPQLGSSPESNNHPGTSQSSMAIKEANPYWFERCILPDTLYLTETVRKTPRRVKPPWKPSVVKTHYKYDSPKEVLTNRNQSTRLSKNHVSRRVTRSHPVEIRRCESLGSLSCLCDVRLQTGKAHLRRCSAARKVQARKTDVDDLESVTNTNTYFPIPSPGQVTKRPATIRSVCCQTPFRRNRPWYSSNLSIQRSGRAFRRKKLSATSLESTSPTLCSDSSTQHESIHQCSTVHDDAFPLRYVFYVEDLPRFVSVFANAGKVSMMARDTQCRVYFQTQIRRSLGVGRVLGQQTSGAHQALSVIEPALYYQGKRVRPVTVAAPNWTSLLRFIKLLDMHYPEFRASAFLTQRLILPGKETDPDNTKSL